MKLCVSCRNSEIKLKYSLKLENGLKNVNNLKIFKCKRCSLVFSNFLDYPDEIDSIYEENYFEKYDTSLKDNPKIKTYKKAIRTINKIKKKKGNLLDLGCGEGNFLVLAKKRGWNCYGVDLSKYATNIAKKRKLNVSNKLLEEIKFKEKYFDVITLWDAIEHLSDLPKVFKELSRILKDDGTIIIRTPNEQSVFHSLAHWIYILSFRTIIFPIKTIYHTDHLYYFSELTLSKVLKKNGFIPKKILMNDQTAMAFEKKHINFLIGIVRAFGKILRKEHALLAFAVKKSRLEVQK